jgi:hypothetical protein
MRNIEPASPVFTPHSEFRTPHFHYPDLESNQDLDLRRVQCDPLHHRDRIYFGFVISDFGFRN